MKELFLQRKGFLFQGCPIFRVKELFLSKKCSLLERCPHFRRVLREGFRCRRFVWSLERGSAVDAVFGP